MRCLTGSNDHSLSRQGCLSWGEIAMLRWIIGHLMSAAGAYLAANWISLALYLILAAVVCAAVRKFMALYRGLPLIVGVGVLVIGAWTIGYRSGPVKLKVQTVERTVEKPVIDHSGMDRLRGQLAALT